jgi:hypothetical protein
MFPSVQSALLVAALILMAATSAAQNQQKYDVSGNDSYRIGTSMPMTTIAYTGGQRLTVEQSGKDRRYTAEASYTRSDDSGKATVHARFVQELTGGGEFQDKTDEDPDFLTILNQPFAVQLDPTTMRDLGSMRREIPFEAQSPLGGAMLHGFLRPRPAGKINGRPVIGVHFEAEGPMTGPLPQRPGAKISGKVRMDGAAYYAAQSALLLALDATLTIDGSLVNNRDSVPVRIVYRRTIRADDSAPSWNEAKSP